MNTDERERSPGQPRFLTIRKRGWIRDDTVDSWRSRRNGYIVPLQMQRPTPLKAAALHLNLARGNGSICASDGQLAWNCDWFDAGACRCLRCGVVVAPRERLARGCFGSQCAACDCDWPRGRMDSH